MGRQPIGPATNEALQAKEYRRRCARPERWDTIDRPPASVLGNGLLMSIDLEMNGSAGISTVRRFGSRDGPESAACDCSKTPGVRRPRRIIGRRPVSPRVVVWSSCIIR